MNLVVNNSIRNAARSKIAARLLTLSLSSNSGRGVMAESFV